MPNKQGPSALGGVKKKECYQCMLIYIIYSLKQVANFRISYPIYALLKPEPFTRWLVSRKDTYTCKPRGSVLRKPLNYQFLYKDELSTLQQFPETLRFYAMTQGYSLYYTDVVISLRRHLSGKQFPISNLVIDQNKTRINCPGTRCGPNINEYYLTPTCRCVSMFLLLG